MLFFGHKQIFCYCNVPLHLNNMFASEVIFCLNTNCLLVLCVLTCFLRTFKGLQALNLKLLGQSHSGGEDTFDFV